MNAGKVKAVSAFLTVILVTGGGLAPAIGLAANLPVGETTSIPANSALLRQAVGSVMRAEMVDESKQLLGEAMPAKVNDLLSEGSVIGTGARSWAELKWTSVTSRIWQNSVVQIRPSKRSVYLQEGGLTFNLKKDRPDKAPYDIRTKVLQARIHGTTVQVLAKGNVEKISVLEGNIDVRNLQNGSVVHLTPGVVYEVQVRGVIKTTAPNYDLFDKTGTKKAEPVSELPGASGRSIAEVPEFRLNPRRGELIFQDSHTRALAYTANSKAILEHPLIGGNNPIPSIDLIEDAIGSLPGESTSDGKLDRVIAKNFKISRVPSRTSYAIGPNVGEGLPLPDVALTDNAPSGRVENVNLDKIVLQAPKIAPVMTGPAFRELGQPGEEMDLLDEPESTNGEGAIVVPQPLSPSSAEFTTQERILPVVHSDAVVGSPMPVFTNPISSSVGPLGSMLNDRRSNSEIVNLNVLGSRN